MPVWIPGQRRTIHIASMIPWRWRIFYLLDEQADGSMDGIMQVNELSAEKSVTQHFLHFRIFEETKGTGRLRF